MVISVCFRFSGGGRGGGGPKELEQTEKLLPFPGVRLKGACVRVCGGACACAETKTPLHAVRHNRRVTKSCYLYKLFSLSLSTSNPVRPFLFSFSIFGATSPCFLFCHSRPALRDFCLEHQLATAANTSCVSPHIHTHTRKSKKQNYNNNNIHAIGTFSTCGTISERGGGRDCLSLSSKTKKQR